MNFIKHMEAVFVATATLALSGSLLIDTLPSAHAKAPAYTTSAVHSVVVKAKRMTAEEKLQSLREERNAPASRV
jgi:hypothetical protein